MPELLFELGCEEIPAEDLFALPSELQHLASESFEANRLTGSVIETAATPRRLTLCAELESMQHDLRELKMGPPKKAALDSSGNPTPAALGFARNLGVPFESLRFEQTAKGEYLAGELILQGRLTTEVLQELIPALVPKLQFKKFMKWGSEDFLFGRPIRRILLTFEGKVVPIVIAGVASDNTTFGHRFLGSDRIQVRSYFDYRQLLRENGVLLTFEERLAAIESGLRSQVAASGGLLRVDFDLMKIMANEVEFPEVLRGNFAYRFLELPQEILINAMRKHQKYFCAVDAHGRLLPHFLAILNTRAEKADLIRQGHERVLSARLHDAEFFWREDLRTKLKDRRSLLSGLTYHEKLGPADKFYNKKVERMDRIAGEILKQIGRTDLENTLVSLIQICKTDLVTLMVGEFPELQGVMAGLYAHAEGYKEEQWMTLYDQYMPVSMDDPLPRNQLGALLSLTDRIETVITGYVLNMIPTGSKDPYGLRRIATGIVRIALEYQLDLNFVSLFEKVIQFWPVPKGKLKPDELAQAFYDLIEARFSFLMEQKGISQEALNAVLNAEKQSLVRAQAKIVALGSIRESADLKTLARGFKRINNIIRDQPQHPFAPKLLVEEGEKRLHRAFEDLEPRLKEFIAAGSYPEAVSLMVTLGPEIDHFFDKVLVMAEDTKLRNNRIALLQQISDLYRNIADFSALQIEL